MEEKLEIKKLYSFLCGIEKSVSNSRDAKLVSDNLCKVFNKLLKDIIDLIDDDSLRLFMINPTETNQRNLTIKTNKYYDSAEGNIKK